MGKAAAGFLIQQQLDQLTTDVNTELQNVPLSPQSPLSEFVWIRKNGGKVGETTQFTLRLWANPFEVRNPYEELPGRKPLIGRFSVTHLERAPDAEVVPRGTKVMDVYNIVKDDICPDMLSRLEITYADDIAKLIGTGTTTTTVFDNQPFFIDTLSHEAAPGKANSPKFANWLKVNPLNEAGLLKGLNQLDIMPAADGNEMDAAGEILCICSTRDQYHRALKFYRGEYVETAVGAAAATKYNSLKDVARPVYLKQMRKYYTNGAGTATGDGWCLVKIASDKHRPFGLSFTEEGEPQVFIEGASINDHSRVTNNTQKVGCRGYWGAFYMWPQFAVLSTETA